MEEQEKQKQQQAYQSYVERVTPKKNLWLRMAGAFFVGGLICVLGQIILHIGKNMGLDDKTASAWCSLILVLLSVVLTGLNLYQKIAAWGGAGTLVPITGFANSVAAPAVEFQKEGQVFGIGCKIFTIAGPVILYGIVCSSALGFIYYILSYVI